MPDAPEDEQNEDGTEKKHKSMIVKNKKKDKKKDQKQKTD
jgi:hypothetical protein